jgi:protoheme IX farnesyltransferase
MSRAVVRPEILVRAPAWRDLLALTKPRISLMSVIVALGSMALAPTSLGFANALTVLAGVWLSVAGAGALNMYLERDVDGRMTRTKTRPLPAGRLDGFWALLLGVSLSAVSLPLMVQGSNGLVAPALTAFALFLYVLVYTPMKQRSAWSLMVGAVPGAMPALMGYSASTGGIDAVGLTLFGIMFLWQLPHFIAIGIYRDKEYAAAGHKLFNHGRSLDFAKTMIIGTTVPLVAVAIMLWPLGVGSWVYGAVASLLGVWFALLSVSGFSADNSNRWARRVFLGSLVYQTVLFATLALDVGLRALLFA